MMEGFSEIMTLEETAKYLKIGKSTLYKMAREGKIPAVKIANQWRFRKEDIDKWLQEIRNKEILSNKEK
jgi:excisionase family DNA binding protein